jgi:hypothetical protein
MDQNPFFENPEIQIIVIEPACHKTWKIETLQMRKDSTKHLGDITKMLFCA